MTRSKFSTKAVLLATAIGLSTAAFAGSQTAAAQSYTFPGGLAYDPAVGCSTLGGGDYGYYCYPPKLFCPHPYEPPRLYHCFCHCPLGGVGRAVGGGSGF